MQQHITCMPSPTLAHNSTLSHSTLSTLTELSQAGSLRHAVRARSTAR